MAEIEQVEHGCLTDPAAQIPAAMAMPDPGEGGTAARTTCAVCARVWLLVGRYGFVYWTAEDEEVPCPRP